MATDDDDQTTPQALGYRHLEPDQNQGPVGYRYVDHLDPYAALTRRPEPAPAPSPPKEDEVGALGAGLAGAAGNLKLLGARFMQMEHMPEWSKPVEQSAEESFKKAEKFKPMDWRDVHGVGDAGQFVYEQAAGMLPPIAATVGGTTLGTMMGGPAGGIAGAIAANAPLMIGGNLAEQMKTNNIPLAETNLAKASGAGLVQSAIYAVPPLQFLKYLPVPQATNMILRAAMSGIEGGAMGAGQNVLVDAIQQVQANPDKFAEMSPEVQKRLIDAAVMGGLPMAAAAAYHGARYGRGAKLEPVARDEATETPAPAAPSDEPFLPGIIKEGEGALKQGEQAISSPAGEEQAIRYGSALATHAAMGSSALRRMGGALERAVPEYPPGVTPNPAVPNEDQTPNERMAATMAARKTGDQVYDNVNSQLLDVGFKPMEAAHNAKIWREIYTTQAASLDKPTDAMSLYKAYPLEVVRDQDGKPKIASGVTYAQEDAAAGVDFSKLRATPTSPVGEFIEEANPKGAWTGQKWLNELTRQPGVKKDELIWSQLADKLEANRNNPVTKDQIQQWYKPYSLDVMRFADRDEDNSPTRYMGKPKWKGYTIGEAGNDPKYNYEELAFVEHPQELTPDQIEKNREIGDIKLVNGKYLARPFGYATYRHETHFPNREVAPLIAHARNTSQLTTEGVEGVKPGEKVLQTHEWQSDPHQEARERGYLGGDVQATAKIRDEVADRVAPVVKEKMPEWAERNKDWRTDNASLLDDLRYEMARFDRVNKTRQQEGMEQWPDKYAPVRDAMRPYNKADFDWNAARSGVPQMPFKNNQWVNMLAKHLVMHAVNNDKDWLAIPTGELSAEAQHHDERRLSAEAVKEKIAAHTKFMEGHVQKILQDLGKPFGAEVRRIRVDLPEKPSGEANRIEVRATNGTLLRRIMPEDFEYHIASHTNAITESKTTIDERTKRLEEVRQAEVPSPEKMKELEDRNDQLHTRANILRNEHDRLERRRPRTEESRAEVNQLLAENRQRIRDNNTALEHNYDERTVGRYRENRIRNAERDIADAKEQIQRSETMLEALRRAKEDYERKLKEAPPQPGREVIALHLTPALKEAVKQHGFSLFQDRRGQITFMPDHAVVRLFKAADHSTFMHESAHFFLNNMAQLAGKSRLINKDLQEVMGWLGVKDGDFRNITTEQHEKFAQGFEKYLQTGKAPTSVLRDTFRQFKQWLQKIYSRGKELGVEVPQHIRQVFDRMLGSEREEPKVQEPLTKGTRPLGEKLERPSSPVGDEDPRIQASLRRLQDEDLPPTERAFLMRNIQELRGEVQPRELAAGRAAQVYEPERELTHEPGAESASAYDQLAHAPQTFAQAQIAKPQLAKAVTARAEKLGGWLKDVFDPLSRVPEATKYLKLRNLFAGNIATGEELEKRARDLYKGMSKEDMDKVNAYLTGSNAIPFNIPKKYRDQTVEFRQRLDALGQMAVNHHLLPQETYEANKGRYLPRIYLMHMLQHEGIVSGLKMSGDFFKKRDPTLSVEARAAKGEISHPAVTVGMALTRLTRDISSSDFMRQVFKNSEWAQPASMTKWRGEQVSRQWLLEEANALDGERSKAAVGLGNHAQAKWMKEEAQRMREEAYKVMDQNYDPAEWKKLPNTAQYGVMRGAWVRKQIADDITGMTDFVNPTSNMAKLLGDNNSLLVKMGRMWKTGKVPLNPAAQARNFVSNLVQAHIIGGVSPWRMAAMLPDVIREMRTDGNMWRTAKRYGMTHGTMAESELHNLANLIAKGDISDKSMSGLAKIGYQLARAAQPFTHAYGQVEAAFKMAVMKDAIERRHMDPGDAAILANRAIADYSMVSPSVRYLRNAPLGMPFVTFYYKMLPELAKTIMTKDGAMRALPYFALGATVPAMVAQSMLNLQEGDVDKLRMAMSEGLRQQNSMYLVPYKDQNGRFQFVDIGYFFPWQMPVDFGMDTFHAVRDISAGHTQDALSDMGQAYKSLNLFSNPAISVLSALNTGIDPFTQQPIADKRDPLQKQVLSWMGYGWAQAAPTIATNYGIAGRLIDKYKGEGVNRYGEPQNDWVQIAGRLFGVNTYSVEPDAMRARNLLHMQSNIQQVKGRMSYAVRDKGLTPEQRQRVAKDYVDRIRELTVQMQDYARESQLTPSIRAQLQPRQGMSQ